MVEIWKLSALSFLKRPHYNYWLGFGISIGHQISTTESVSTVNFIILMSQIVKQSFPRRKSSPNEYLHRVGKSNFEEDIALKETSTRFSPKKNISSKQDKIPRKTHTMSSPRTLERSKGF